MVTRHNLHLAWSLARVSSPKAGQVKLAALQPDYDFGSPEKQVML
jgi:hypothetical protein